MTTSPGKVESLDGVLMVDEGPWRALSWAGCVVDELALMRVVVAEIVYRVIVTVETVEEGTTVVAVVATIVVVVVVVNAVVEAVETIVCTVEPVVVVRGVE